MMAGPLLHAIALGMLLACFAAFSVASFRHFDPESRSRGNLIIRMLTLVGTLGNVVLCVLAWPVSVPLGGLAILMAALSLIVFRAAIGSAPTGELHVAFTGDGPEQLVTSGIYRWIRNPLYTSYLAFWAGWMPASGLHPVSVVCFALFLCLYWFAVREEERFLSERFGSAYTEFKSCSGRFLPRMRMLRS